MSAEWEDATSRSRGQASAPATTWNLPIAGGFRLAITCAHRHYPGRWIAHLHMGCWENRDLGPDTLTAREAQALALNAEHETFASAGEDVRVAMRRPA